MVAADLRPELSVVVAPTTRGSRLPACLEALESQRDPPGMEVLVPIDESIENVDELRRRHPAVRFVPVAGIEELARSSDLGLAHEAIDRRRSAGLAAARGSLVALTEEAARPAADWCARIVAAHGDDHEVIGGAIENGADRPLNWAVYFSDLGRYQNPLQEGPASFVSDVNVSYKGPALEQAREVWGEVYDEAVLHDAIRRSGGTLWLRADLVVTVDRASMPLTAALRERYAWARVYAGRRSGEVSAPKRLAMLVGSPLLVVLLSWRQTRLSFTRGRHRGAFLRAFPLLVAMNLFWSLGEFVGYLTGRAARPRS